MAKADVFWGNRDNLVCMGVKLRGAGTMCISVTLYEIAEFYLVVSGEFSNFAAMIAKRLTGIIVLGAMMLLTGCSGDGYTPELLAIDSILNEKPDSALRLLDSLGTEARSWSKSQRMRHSLLTMSRGAPCRRLLSRCHQLGRHNRHRL